MKTFTDTEGRPWTIDLNITTVKRIRSRLNIDLMKISDGDPPLVTVLQQDVILLCDVIYVAIEPVATALGVKDEQFGAALGGKAILDASEAFWGALQDFFQSQGKQALANVIEKAQAMQAAGMRAVLTEVNKIDPEKVIADAIHGSLSTS